MNDGTPVILVVDDNPATRYATTRVLQSAGFTVIEAATGQDGIDRSIHADAVVLDVNLPDIDGFSVCRQIRENPLTSRTPVIHLSATFTQSSYKVRGLEAGADSYLTHPVEPPVLVATVEAFLRTRNAEEAMRRSEAKFRAVFDNALNGIALVDRELVYLEVNSAMCRLLGRSREEIVGRNGVDFIPLEMQPEAREISALLERTGSWTGSFPLKRLDGALVYIEWNVSTHSFPGVRLAVATDVTERKLAEQQRQELLQREKAARTEAERANRMKDEFLATLSHELRTPLNAILGWACLLQRRGIFEGTEKGLATIERNARAQAALIEDLLDMSRINSGKVFLELANIDLGALVETAVETARPSAEAKGIKMVSDTSTPVIVLADIRRLQQVLSNLLSNAVKFTPSGGAITIAMHTSSSQVTVSITDSGIGIASDFLPHVFERFRQADAATTRSHGGLGLGLAISSQLAAMHGGRITATSPGEHLGSTFSITLPRTEGATVPSIKPVNLDDREEPIDLTGVRVFIVDDEPDSLSLLERLLVEQGAAVYGSSTVAEALIRLADVKPDVLVSDIGMPERDGYDLIRSLRSGNSTVPAVALTAFARPEDREQALRAGYQCHLAKPVDADELIEAVAQMVGLRNAALRANA